MEEQDSILIQKKMILVLSLIILTLIATLTYTNNDFNDARIATLNEYKQDLITVEKEEIFGKDIIIEQVAYTASKEVVEVEENDNAETQRNEASNEQTEDKNAEITNEENVQNTKKEEGVTTQENQSKVSYKELAENNPPEEYQSVIEVTATAYCLCEKCCGKSPSNPGYGVTASGYKIVPGTGVKVIAVDPKLIPLGTKVYVEGLNGAWDYGYAVAADTGGAIKNMKIDLYMDSHTETLNWGVKKVNVYVLNEE